MADIIAKVVGGTKKLVEADDISEVADELGVDLATYTVAVNGAPADPEDDVGLNDGDVVTFSTKVKGG